MAGKSTPKAGSRPGGGKAGGSRSAGNKPGGNQNRPGTSKQRAKAARAVAAAQAARSRRNTMLVTISVCAVIVIVVIGAVAYALYRTNLAKNDTITAKSVSASFPVKIENGLIVAGKNSAKTKITIYEDFICPYCAQLEQGKGQEMLNDMNDGKLQITYRIVDFLNNSSNPPGYSQRAANAAYATVAAGKFTSYHWSLYHDQPEEQSPGYSNAQLLSLGKRLGITGSAYTTFEKQVKAGTYNSDISSSTKKLQTDTSLRGSDGSYGTPTVVYNGKKIDTSGSSWLSSLISKNG